MGLFHKDLKIAKGLREAIVDPIKQDWYDVSHALNDYEYLPGHKLGDTLTLGPPIRAVKNLTEGDLTGAAIEGYNTVTMPSRSLIQSAVTGLVPYVGSGLASFAHRQGWFNQGGEASTPTPSYSATPQRRQPGLSQARPSLKPPAK